MFFGSTIDELSTIETTTLASTAIISHSWYYYVIPIVSASLFIFVIDFYAESYTTQKTEPVFSAKFGALFAFVCSFCLSFVWNHPHLVRVTVMDKIKTIIEQEHALSWGVIISFALYSLGNSCFSFRIFSFIFFLYLSMFNNIEKKTYAQYIT
jgi:hypothetical protein